MVKNVDNVFYAHTKEGEPPEEWQRLEDHLEKTSKLAASFASMFNSADWAKTVGILHDLGKANSDFQAYIHKVCGLDASEYDGESTRTHPNHSGVGAILSYERWPNIIGKTIAYIIAGHHAGLPDWFGGRDSLPNRFDSEKSVADECVRSYAELFFASLSDKLQPPAYALQCHNHYAISYHLWVRMLFSCLVDADFLNTEAFMDATKHALRPSFPVLIELKTRFDREMQKMTAEAPDTPVNRIRADILAKCRMAAMQGPGLFSLTVPTGGGKTLSGTAFALDHATNPKHNKSRIIYVIPYTSIIEQTADELRKYFGPQNVIEHHSNIAPEKETPRHTLAAENWDAPIIVTTSVQFFESLYAAKPSRCRKLHNIVN
ncbi:MAG TPA: CRISPR-associated endonuclease Cas3'', partial [Deltaproteobacteria bacterium]|nr:CRISPR-associated endonuclease Cas3'' [Deltaproteobacteria bacterium]